MDELQQDAAAAARVAEEAAELRAVEAGSYPAVYVYLISLCHEMVHSRCDCKCESALDESMPSGVLNAGIRVQAAAQLRLAEAAREVEALRAKLAAASGAASAKAESLAEQHRELKQVSEAAAAMHVQGISRCLALCDHCQC